MLNVKGYSEIELIYQGYGADSSIVYKGIRDVDGKTVALKVPASKTVDARKVSSISREYFLLQNHNLKNVPKALDLLHNGPSLVLVTEYVQAPALRDLLSDQPMQLSAFFSIAIPLVEILVELHSHNLIHCDLTPGNILFDSDAGKIQLIDFGCALEFPRHARTIINPSLIQASPAFMSPEQTGRLNRGLDYRTDFYSLGIIFYRLLTGQMPFPTEDKSELIHSHIAVTAPPPSHLEKEIPQILSELILKLLKKDPLDRYQSAEGIRLDLVALNNLQLHDNARASIDLASADVKDRFIIPDKLYGRQSECKELVNLFRRAANGCGQIALISGQAGIGKTSLARELFAPLTEQGGYLAFGKFDQYQRNQPYSALTSALSNLFRQILAEKDEIVNVWRQAIIAVLGPNGRLITDVIPGLEMIIGPQPEVSDLPVIEARERFANLFTKFIEQLGKVHSPIVIFLDDLQWIDPPSLELLERVGSNVENTKLFIAGAYRDDEVPPTHRLAIAITEMRGRTDSLHEINLEELPPASLIELLVDTLKIDEKRLSPLNNILLDKTHGNPLFFKTMLDGLYSDGHIYFDYEDQTWAWDQQLIASTPYADNVVDLLQSRIPALAGGQADILSIAACLGNIFDLNHLAHLANIPRHEVARNLVASVCSGLIQPIGGDFELLIEDKANTLPSITFKFAHDRIQQAAYQQLEEHRKPPLHLQFGELLLTEIEREEGSQKLFAAVANLNKGKELIASDERLRLSRLNLKAGKMAKEAAAFIDAHEYLSIALEQIGEISWDYDYQFVQEVHLELAEACYLTGDFDSAENLYSLIREKSVAVNDLLILINIQAKQYHHQGRYLEAIDLELEGLSLLGINLPEKDEQLHELFIKEGQNIIKLLDGRRIKELTKSKTIDDAQLTLTHSILFDLFADGYLMGRGALLACAAVISTRLSIEQGICTMSSIGFINYATCLCAGGQYTEGREFGKVAVKLSDHYQVAALKNYTYHLYALSINHWIKPLDSSYNYWREASKLALESGSPYSGWVFLQLAHVLLASGASLDRVEEQLNESKRYLNSAGLKDIAFMLQLIVTQPVRHLRGATKDITTLDDETFNCTQLMEENKDALFFLSHILYSMLRATLIGRDIQPLAAMSGWMEMFSQTMQGQFIHVDCYFYFALHLSAGCTKLEGDERIAYLNAIDDTLERFATWRELCSHNYEHKYLLITAERKRLDGKNVEAMNLYDKAIDLAYDSSFIQDAAIANECAGLFWLELEKERFAMNYMEDALFAYDRWGAIGKVYHLEDQYPALASAKRDGRGEYSLLKSSGTHDFSAQLDLESILKVSQAISRHMVVDKLAGELIDLAMKNAGATKAVLQLMQGERLATRKSSVVNNSDRPNHVAENSEGELTVPEEVRNYVLRTRESLVIDNAMKDNRLSRSEYIQDYHPKSICCVPILIKKEVYGLLYLENSQTSSAFREDRLQVLKAIASQAAISLENAKVYQELEELNKNLEQKVLERTKEINDKNVELQVLSVTDQLTGLYNRRHIEQTIRDEISRSTRYQVPLSLILFDIDHFKKVNDTFGHDVGDNVLRSVAEVLKENTRKSDMAGRWGGEEFLVLLPQTGAELSKKAAEKLRIALEEKHVQQVGRVTASFGVAKFLAGDDVDTFIKRADLALYDAKRNGRNQVVASADSQS